MDQEEETTVRSSADAKMPIPPKAVSSESSGRKTQFRITTLRGSP